MYGSIIAVGLIVFLVAPFFAKLLRFFPPIVTGTLLTVMGTTLLSVSAGDIVAWADKAADDSAKASATFEALGFAFGTIAIIVIIQRLFKGFMGTLSVLLALLIMTALAFAMGKTNFSGVGEASWLGVTTPFYFGLPRFSRRRATSLPRARSWASASRRETLPTPCGPTAYPRSWAASSTPSLTPASLKTWDWCASPA